MRAHVFAGLATTLVLAGCGPARPVLGPAAVISNQGSDVALTRAVTVASGAIVKVHFVAPINPDCTPVDGGSVKAVKQPAQGSLAIKPAEDFVTFLAANPRSACNTRRVKGTVVEYQSKPGFKGVDTLAYDVFTSRGLAVHYTVTVNVQ